MGIEICENTEQKCLNQTVGSHILMKKPRAKGKMSFLSPRLHLSHVRRIRHMKGARRHDMDESHFQHLTGEGSCLPLPVNQNRTDHT
jgi:hypothetical protein